MRHELSFQRMRRRMMLVAAVSLLPVAFAPQAASAQNLFDMLFGGASRQQTRPPAAVPDPSSTFADPNSANPQTYVPSAPQATLPQRHAGATPSGPAFCVRSCDGRYFPLSRGLASPAQMCQAFCPASPTKVYYGSTIDGAYASNGERYADSENAFAYRKSLRADCTCNGRDPTGLAPVDLTLDTSLRAGDVVATTDGLVAYSGVRIGNEQSAEFTPVASYPGLTSEVRARLTALKVAPVSAEMVAGDAQPATIGPDEIRTGSIAPQSPLPARARRAALD